MQDVGADAGREVMRGGDDADMFGLIHLVSVPVFSVAVLGVAVFEVLFEAVRRFMLDFVLI